MTVYKCDAENAPDRRLFIYPLAPRLFFFFFFFGVCDSTNFVSEKNSFFCLDHERAHFPNQILPQMDIACQVCTYTGASEESNKCSSCGSLLSVTGCIVAPCEDTCYDISLCVTREKEAFLHTITTTKQESGGMIPLHGRINVDADTADTEEVIVVGDDGDEEREMICGNHPITTHSSATAADAHIVVISADSSGAPGVQTAVTRSRPANSAPAGTLDANNNDQGCEFKLHKMVLASHCLCLSRHLLDNKPASPLGDKKSGDTVRIPSASVPKEECTPTLDSKGDSVTSDGIGETDKKQVLAFRQSRPYCPHKQTPLVLVTRYSPIVVNAMVHFMYTGSFTPNDRVAPRGICHELFALAVEWGNDHAARVAFACMCEHATLEPLPKYLDTICAINKINVCCCAVGDLSRDDRRDNDDKCGAGHSSAQKTKIETTLTACGELLESLCATRRSAAESGTGCPNNKGTGDCWTAMLREEAMLLWFRKLGDTIAPTAMTRSPITAAPKSSLLLTDTEKQKAESETKAPAKKESIGLLETPTATMPATLQPHIHGELAVKRSCSCSSFILPCAIRMSRHVVTAFAHFAEQWYRQRCATATTNVEVCVAAFLHDFKNPTTARCMLHPALACLCMLPFATLDPIRHYVDAQSAQLDEAVIVADAMRTGNSGSRFKDIRVKLSSAGYTEARIMDVLEKVFDCNINPACGGGSGGVVSRNNNNTNDNGMLIVRSVGMGPGLDVHFMRRSSEDRLHAHTREYGAWVWHEPVELGATYAFRVQYGRKDEPNSRRIILGVVPAGTQGSTLDIFKEPNTTFFYTHYSTIVRGSAHVLTAENPLGSSKIHTILMTVEKSDSDDSCLVVRYNSVSSGGCVFLAKYELHKTRANYHPAVGIVDPDASVTFSCVKHC